MNLFDYENYKQYVTDRIESMPKKGRGQYRKMANYLSVNSVSVTQIFKGDRNLSLEQACLLGDFFGLNSLEADYFLNLVELERAGHFKLKEVIQARLQKIRAQSKDLKKVLGAVRELTEADRARFYSSWYYSAIRLWTSLRGSHNVDTISEHFDLPKDKVSEAIEFLLSTGLCVEVKGQLKMGPSSTHLESTSSLIPRQHTNWRLKAIEHFEKIDEEELSLSMPCSLAAKDIPLIRKELVHCIDRITKIIDKGPEEKLACINIDWFKL